MDVDAAAQLTGADADLDNSIFGIAATDIECRSDLPKKVVRHSAMSAQQQIDRVCHPP